VHIARARAVRAQGARPSLLEAATYGVLVGPAIQRLRELPVEHLVVTDSVPSAPDLPLSIDVVSIDRLLADAISRLHDDKPLDDLGEYA
jgi:ribose-phosphate pyrophosphokinase